MKKCQPQLRSQHKIITTNTYIDHTPKIFNRPLNKLEKYEIVLDEYLDNNPKLSESELIKLCIGIAKQCGLSLSPKITGGYSNV